MAWAPSELWTLKGPDFISIFRASKATRSGRYHTCGFKILSYLPPRMRQRQRGLLGIAYADLRFCIIGLSNETKARIRYCACKFKFVYYRLNVFQSERDRDTLNRDVIIMLYSMGKWCTHQTLVLVIARRFKNVDLLFFWLKWRKCSIDKIIYLSREMKVIPLRNANITKHLS